MTVATARDTTTHLLYSIPPVDQEPYQWINDPRPGEPRSNVGSEAFPWQIRDLRAGSISYGLDKTGFDAVKFPSHTTLETFSDDEEVKSRYYPEVEALLKDATGAHRVMIFDHTIRNVPPKGVEIPDTPTTRQPVSRVHVDQTPESAINRVKRHLGDDAEKLLEGRIRLINVWRPLRGPVKDVPLAVADFNSMDVSRDLCSSNLIYSPEMVGKTFLVKHNPQHRWYFMSDMEVEDALLLKCFDSASIATPDGLKEGIAALAPHTAFEDEYVMGSGFEGPPRVSCEVRALCFG